MTTQEKESAFLHWGKGLVKDRDLAELITLLQVAEVANGPDGFALTCLLEGAIAHLEAKADAKAKRKRVARPALKLAR